MFYILSFLAGMLCAHLRAWFVARRSIPTPVLTVTSVFGIEDKPDHTYPLEQVMATAQEALDGTSNPRS